MSQLERLTDLLKQADEHSASRCITDYDEATADNASFLLENGVIVPPVKIGQTVYSLEKGIYSQFFNGEVYEIQIRREGVVFRATRRGYYTLAFTEENIGKTVFFTPEEAEAAIAAALAERSKRK